jgi:hypothetical protein
VISLYAFVLRAGIVMGSSDSASHTGPIFDGWASLWHTFSIGSYGSRPNSVLIRRALSPIRVQVLPTGYARCMLTFSGEWCAGTTQRTSEMPALYRANQAENLLYTSGLRADIVTYSNIGVSQVMPLVEELASSFSGPTRCPRCMGRSKP